MRKQPEDFTPVKPFSLKSSIEAVYKGFNEFWKPFSKIEPRKQVDFAAGVYAQMQLNNPELLFPGAASFIVTNIYQQTDTQFPSIALPIAYQQLIPGTLTVFKELGPSFTCLAIAKRNQWNSFDVVKKLLKREEGVIEEYRSAGLEYAIIKKPLLHAKMTLMNEQYKTLQPLLYGAWYQKFAYSAASSLGVVKQQIVFSANPGQRSETLTVVPQLFSGPYYNFKSPEQRYNFGSRVLETYFDLCRHESPYVISELEKIRDRGREADPLLWKLYVEPVLPTRPREEVEKDFKETFGGILEG